MSDFADVEQFAREHATCGGLTPKATSSSGGGGYQLTITCACGATHNRWVNLDEASRPVPRRPRSPLPAPTPSPFRSSPVRPLPLPQPVEVAVAPARPSSGRVVWVVLIVLLLLGTGAGVYLTDSGPLTALNRPGAAAPPKRVATPTPVSEAPARTLPALTDATASREPVTPPSGPAPIASAPAAPVPTPGQSAGDVVRVLRQLQSAAKPTATLDAYAGRVASTRVEIERLVASGSPLLRTQALDVLEIHRLAASAWRARTVNEREEWARVGRDPAVELCPSVKRAVDDAGPASRAVPRGAAVATALPQLWECAAEKIAALGRGSPGG
jgi:hypothetical protein